MFRSYFVRFYVGLIFAVLAFWGLVLRMFGVIGQAFSVDGFLIIVGLLAVLGLVFMASAVNEGKHDRRDRYRDRDEDGE